MKSVVISKHRKGMQPLFKDICKVWKRPADSGGRNTHIYYWKYSTTSRSCALKHHLSKNIRIISKMYFKCGKQKGSHSVLLWCTCMMYNFINWWEFNLKQMHCILFYYMYVAVLWEPCVSKMSTFNELRPIFSSVTMHFPVNPRRFYC